jgi:ABC-2 type transport system ATP-binding protein
VVDNRIEVRGLVKKYGEFAAVDGVSFDVKDNSIFAFLGPNGAGKSTTIGVLSTVQGRSAGEVRIGGRDVARDRDAVRRDLGVVFQESTLDGKLTVRENLRLHLSFYGIPRAEVPRRTEAALALVDMEEWGNAPAESLSGGMKRRVEIARALSHEPRVLFLDEPTTGLDPQTRANVWECVRRLQATRGTTVFLTTHSMEEAEIADHVVVIDKGKVVADDTPAHLKRLHTRTTLRARMDDPAGLEAFLRETGLEPRLRDGWLEAKVPGAALVVEAVRRFGGDLRDLEVSKGTLNDVFIALTGKEIRE